MTFHSKKDGVRKMNAKVRIVDFKNPVPLHRWGTEEEAIIAEVMHITPTDAASWLKANCKNRPVRKRHVEFLANEMKDGNWQLNGQGIVISHDEQVLDGQHRLLAIIECGLTIPSLVIYGITPEAFKTIDTGAVRSGADALFLHLEDVNNGIVKAVAGAATYCMRLERHTLHRHRAISNTDVIAYVKDNPSLIQCAEQLSGYPRDARPMALSALTALYEMFMRKHEAQATTFMQRFCTGENLTRTDPEFILRAAFMRDSERKAKLPLAARMRMVIKGWNWLRRGNTEANRNTMALMPNDDPKIRIF
jgi:hypothetical protein